MAMYWKYLILFFTVITIGSAVYDPETANAEFTPDGQKLWEGDMLLSDDQVDLFYGDLDLRKATSIKNQLWPNGILYYKLDVSSRGDRKQIEGAMDMWRKETCLDFKEIEGEFKETHVIITKKSGCWSDIGRKFWVDTQELSLGYGCLNPGTIAHEIGHAIGFNHEHSRPDRDKSVKIFSENYDSEKNDNFIKRQYVNNHNVPYDLGSIMHYSQYAFSKNNKKTIAPHDPTKQFLMGQRDHLSFYDRKLAHILYNCSAQCDANIVCMNEGFLNSACECVCKDDFAGKLCETEVPNSSCGGHMVEEGKILSQNYPNYYRHDNKCVWWIEAPEGKEVEAKIEDFEIHKREDEGDCYFDKMEVRTKDVYNGEVFCGEELKGKTIKSEGRSMVFVFTNNSLHKGFSISVKFV